MNFIRKSIKDGVNLTTVYTDISKSSTVTISLVTHLSSFNANALALISRILLRGCEKFPDSKSLCRKFEDNYGTTINISHKKIGENLALTIVLQYLNNNYSLNGENIEETAFSLLNECIFHPLKNENGFNTDYTEREKNALIERILSIKNNKPLYAIKRCISEMCRNEPYSISLLGSTEETENANGKILYDFYINLLQTASVEIVYAGVSDYSVISGYAEKYMPFKGRSFSASVISENIAVDNVNEICEEADTNQSTLVMGFRLDTKNDFHSLALFDGILSSSPVSKLFVNIREKNSLCYYCNTDCDGNKGVYFISAGIDCKNANRVKNAVLKQINDISKGNISDSELSAAVNAEINSYKSIKDDTYSICNYFLNRIYTNRIVSVDDEIDYIKTITKQSAIDYAKTLTLDTVFLLKGTKLV